jgi:hypothetical protein
MGPSQQKLGEKCRLIPESRCGWDAGITGGAESAHRLKGRSGLNSHPLSQLATLPLEPAEVGPSRGSGTPETKGKAGGLSCMP